MHGGSRHLDIIYEEKNEKNGKKPSVFIRNVLSGG